MGTETKQRNLKVFAEPEQVPLLLQALSSRFFIECVAEVTGIGDYQIFTTDQKIDLRLPRAFARGFIAAWDMIKARSGMSFSNLSELEELDYYE